MPLFRKKQVHTMPPQAKKFRQETHEAAADAQEKVAKLNKVMDNGITLKIYLAMGGKHH